MIFYTQLTQEQRYQISSDLKAGFTQSEIARFLSVHKSTISRELRRNRGLRGYRPKQAQTKAMARKAEKVQPRISDASWHQVEILLKEQWSPEQISGWLPNNLGIHISHERIYQYVYEDKYQGGELYKHLRCQRQRKKRYGSYSTRGLIPDRVSIDDRPAIVEKKKRVGDWEADTIIGKNHQQAIVTLTERKTRFTYMEKVTRKTSDLVGQAMIDLLKPVADKVLTITSDNGKEFAGHLKVAEALQTGFYFAHPYASWERGLNENTNGLIRQYFPKKTDFTMIADEEIENVMNKLNNRPRKTLGFKTPNQIFLGIKPTVALAT